VQYRRICLLLAIAVVVAAAASSVAAPNFVVIGSDQAPIIYIKGTGTNIGLYAGVAYEAPAAAAKAGRFSEVGVIRSFRGGQFRNGSGGQGMGKINAAMVDPLWYNPPRDARFLSACDNGMYSHPALGTRPFSLSTSSSSELFEIKPVDEFELNDTGVTEILLPVLCVNQDQDVPIPDRDSFYTESDLTTTAEQAYVGIYRWDKYLNDSLIEKFWTRNDSIFYMAGGLSSADVVLAINSVLVLDSNSYMDPPENLYTVSHGYLLPSFAQYALWAALESQDSATFLDAYNVIRAQNGLGAVDMNYVRGYLQMTHMVLHFGAFDALKAGFDKPDSAEFAPVLDLEPYAFIQTDLTEYASRWNGPGIPFSAYHSFDCDGPIDSLKWECDGDIQYDGTYGVRISYTTQSPGSPTPVVLTVYDSSGQTASDTVMVPYTDGIITDVEDEPSALPADFELRQNYPNPFNAATSIPFTVRRTAFVEIRIINQLGQTVCTVVEDYYRPGSYQATWDGKNQRGDDVASGVYLYQISADAFVAAKKLLLLR